MPYGPRGFQWNEGEVFDLPQTPGGFRPPERGGRSSRDYIDDLISFYMTPRNHQGTTRLDGGTHFGPSRDATVRPGDMDTAMNLMDLQASLSAEKDAEERRMLSLEILREPRGGGTMTLDRGLGKGTRFGRAVPSVRPRSGEVGGGEGGREETMSRREAVALGGEPMSDVERDIEQTRADAYGSYYGARTSAADRVSKSSQAAVIEAAEELPQVLMMLRSESLSPEEKQELEIKRQHYERALAAAGIVFDENGGLRRAPGGGETVRGDDSVTDWTPRP